MAQLRWVKTLVGVDYAAKTIKEIYGKFEHIQMFPEIGADLSKRISF